MNFQLGWHTTLVFILYSGWIIQSSYVHLSMALLTCYMEVAGCNEVASVQGPPSREGGLFPRYSSLSDDTLYRDPIATT